MEVLQRLSMALSVCTMCHHPSCSWRNWMVWAPVSNPGFLLTSWQPDVWPLITTIWFQQFSQFSTQPLHWNHASSLFFLSFRNRNVIEDDVKSHINSIPCSSLIHIVISSQKAMRLVKHSLLLVNPCWLFLIAFFFPVVFGSGFHIDLFHGLSRDRD